MSMLRLQQAMVYNPYHNSAVCPGLEVFCMVHVQRCARLQLFSETQLYVRVWVPVLKRKMGWEVTKLDDGACG